MVLRVVLASWDMVHMVRLVPAYTHETRLAIQLLAAPLKSPHHVRDYL